MTLAVGFWISFAFVVLSFLVAYQIDKLRWRISQLEKDLSEALALWHHTSE